MQPSSMKRKMMTFLLNWLRIFLIKQFTFIELVQRSESRLSAMSKTKANGIKNIGPMSWIKFAESYPASAKLDFASPYLSYLVW